MIIQRNNKMPVLWDSKVKFCQFLSFWGSLVLPLWFCVWTFHNFISYCLTWGKKKKGKEKKKPPADFNPVERVLLVFLIATGRGDLAFAFLPSYGFVRMVTRSGLQHSQLPNHHPRSSVSCQAPTIYLHQV